MDYIYKRETIEAAEEYLLVVTNESTFFRKMEIWFKESNFKPIFNALFPYSVDLTFKEYRRCQNKAHYADRPSFSELCRRIIWNYYVNYYNESYPNICNLEKQYIAYEQSEEDLKAEIDDHIQKADEHFRKVENEMNTLTKYESKPHATVELIHGKPVEDYNEAELVELIRKARAEQDSIKDLISTSQRMKKRHETLSTNIDIYTKALDNLPE